MSSCTRPNHRQPIDFIKQDHTDLIESLRKYEIKLVNTRNVSAEHIKYIDEHGGDFYCTLMDGYTTSKSALAVIDNTLQELYFMLKNYYEYPDEEKYLDVVMSNKLEELPYELDSKVHDGFWGRDPTIPRPEKTDESN